MGTSLAAESSEVGTRLFAREGKPMEVTIFVTVSVLWAAFGVALISSDASIHEVWTRVNDLPLAVRGLLWVAFLPWMAAAGAWEASWALSARLLVVIGLAWATVYSFFPWRPR